MRKICLSISVLSIFLLMVTPVFAQSPRQPTSSEGKTTFTNIGTTGLEVTGVPSYIEMMSTDGSTRYYLYVDSSGNLKIASAVACGYLASPQTVNWLTGGGSGYGEVGVKVGAQ